MNNTTALGKNLRQCREELGLTQSEVSAFLRIEQSYLSKIETGERAPTSSLLEKLCVLFGVSENDILAPAMPVRSFSVAFRRNGFQLEDLSTISAINRLALNLEFMGKLLDKEADR